MLIYWHEYHWSLIPHLLGLLKDLHMSLMKLSLSMLLVLTKTPHNCLAQYAIIWAPAILFAEVYFLFKFLLCFNLLFFSVNLKFFDLIAYFSNPEFRHQQIDSRLHHQAGNLLTVVPFPTKISASSSLAPQTRLIIALLSSRALLVCLPVPLC